VDHAARAGGPERAATFRFKLDSFSGKARVMEALVAARLALFGLPRDAQGLLVPRTLYDAVGGHSGRSTLPDLDLARRMGRRRLVTLRAAALSSSAAIERTGYVRSALSGGLDLARVVARLA
jgi:hypothetical protein